MSPELKSKRAELVNEFNQTYSWTFTEFCHTETLAIMQNYAKLRGNAKLAARFAQLVAELKNETPA